MNYYNEFDTKAAAWLRELIKQGLIPRGEVDERSVSDVSPNDLRGFTQCHFFAGIGGWSYALNLSGWPEDREVWTGSCPCQPFSSAGKRLGKNDPRHLWPQFRRLIRKCRPAIVFGEQVASKDGRLWLDGVFSDLEALAYANAAADLCAAGVNAPHIRQRLFWVANSNGGRREQRFKGIRSVSKPDAGGSNGWLGYANHNGRISGKPSASTNGHRSSPRSDGCARGLGDTDNQGPQGRRFSELRECPDKWASGKTSNIGFWSNFDLIDCRDGKARRVEPGTFPLADGVPGRVGLLRGYGNAIVPQVAAEFIGAYLDIETEPRAALTLL